MWMKLKNVNRVRAKGRTYHYHRKSGGRIKGEPNTQEFYDNWLAEEGKAGNRPDNGDDGLASLIALYKQSPEFIDKADRTKKDYLTHLDYLNATFGDIRVSDWTREEVLDLRDELSGRRADYVVTMLSILFKFALDRPSRFGLESNPAHGVKKVFKARGYTAWPDNLITDFLEKAYPELQWIVQGALYTAQRQGDLHRMNWNQYDGTGIAVVQSKTGERLWIPCDKRFKAVLDNEIPRRATVIFTNSSGKPWGLDHLRHEVAKYVRKAGFEGYSMHGLRYNAAKNPADAGCPNADIMAITGHRTHDMVRQYTREADQKVRALRAMNRLERGTKTAKPTDDSAKPVKGS